MEFLRRSPREVLHECAEASITKLLPIDGHPVLFSICCQNKSHLQVRVLNFPVTPEREAALTKYIREWLDLDTDLKPFYRLAAKDKVLASLVKKFYGYRIVGQPDLFESLVWAVLGQQINLGFAYTLKQRFVEHFGTRISFGDKIWHLFPEPTVVASLKDSDLLPLQFSRQKSDYIIGLGKAFAEGTISREAIGSLSFEEAKIELMKIRGIGNWTANYVLMKTFRYPNAFPLEDAGLHNAIRNNWKMDRKPTLEEVKKIFRKYKGWEAYATLYLWKSL
jgi:DNA-3-methyladenine glycosylase II